MVNEWLLANKLSLNVAKTKFMVFSMPQRKVTPIQLRIADNEIEGVDSFHFLGIEIDKHLNWTSHINRAACKIYKTIGVLNKLKHTLPGSILVTIYTSLIVCHLNYGLLVWGYNLYRITKLQKRAIRVITCSKYNAHSEPLFKNLHLLKIEDIFKVQQLKFYYRLVNDLLPTYFNCFPITPIHQIHQHSTRASSNLYTTRVNHEFAKRCVRHSIIKTLNHAPDLIKNIINTHSGHGFTSYIKTYYLRNYQFTCNVVNCYACLSV